MAEKDYPLIIDTCDASLQVMGGIETGIFVSEADILQAIKIAQPKLESGETYDYPDYITEALLSLFSDKIRDFLTQTPNVRGLIFNVLTCPIRGELGKRISELAHNREALMTILAKEGEVRAA